MVASIYLLLRSHKRHLYHISKAFLNLVFQLYRVITQKASIKRLSELSENIKKIPNNFLKRFHLHQDQKENPVYLLIT